MSSSANVGGQAVLEGVMMRSPGSWAVTVRRPDGGLARVSRPVSSVASRHRWLRLPILRGMVALGESLVIGFRALAVSATYAAVEEGDDPDPEAAAELTRGQIAFAFVIAIGFAVLVFKVSPAIITDLLPIHSTVVFVLVEGAIRVTLLVAYLAGISFIPDLRRVFQYHAAEHKTINAYEDGAELVPERVQAYSKIHLRCGTAFLLWVMVIAIFVFAFVGRPDWPTLIASRVLLLPLIAGLAYEVIRFGGKHPRNPVVRTLLTPGLWLQGLTTREPTLDQVEVSIQALQDVLEAERASGAGSQVEAITSMHADDIVFHNHTAGECVEGAAAVGEHIAGIFRNWPRMRFTGRSLYVREGLIVQEWTATGTHAGSGRTATWDGMDILPTRDGRFARKDVYSDSVSVMRQLGRL